MFNVGGGEVLVILLLALIVLGPDKLPNAAKQAGKYLGDFRRMSHGFQQELRSAMDLDSSSSTPAKPTLVPDPATPAATDPAAEETTTPAAEGPTPVADEPPSADVIDISTARPEPAEPAITTNRLDVDGPTGSFS